MKSFYKFLTIAFLLFSLIEVHEASAQRPIHEIHSMMIFNFIKYVDWPDESKNGAFVISVYGSDEVYDQLTKFYGQRPVKGQDAKIINVSSVADIQQSHVIYLADRKSGDLEDILAKFDNKPTLIISDRNGLGKKGSSINFKEEGGKLKFEINQSTIDNSNLKISSQLLNMGIVL